MITLVLRASLLVVFAAAVAAGAVTVNTSAALTTALMKAKPGTTVQLAPGNYSCTPTIPAGVTLRGAGYMKTILDVGAADTGVTLGGDGASVADLTIATHGGMALLARGVKVISVSGILVRGGAVAVFLQHIDGARIENCILDGSQTGVAMESVTGAAIVNNTLVHTDTAGFSLAKVAGSAVFNNLVAHAGVAISVTQPSAGLLVDHNLYLATFAGKYENEYRRVSLGPWRDVSGGLDAQSVCLPVTFRDVTNGDYQPVSTLDWNPGIATTANWGIAKLGGVAAPARDILGTVRPANPGVGAREAAVENRFMRATDGSFEVKESGGTKSAGVFTPDGTAVRYLFRDLPLPAGTYGFVLPSRSEQGANIAAGAYELRLVESNLRWTYRGITGNNGQGNLPGESDKDSVTAMSFGPDYSLITSTGWSEHGENVKCRDLTTRKPRWVLPGQDAPVGICLGEDGLVYLLRNDSVIRFDNAGQLKPWATGGVRLPVSIAGANGVAELGGNLFVTSKSGEVMRVSIATGKQDMAFKVENPKSLVADRQRGLLWMLCDVDRAVTACEPDGIVKYTFKPVVNPLALAVNGDRLAIADCDAGKVRFFDIHDPSAPVAKQTIGRGDSPIGPIAADRFRFMKSPGTLVLMDMDAIGRLAVLDGIGRPLVFAPDGAGVYMSLCAFAYDPIWNNYDGEEDGLTHMYFGSQSWTIDARKGTWAPEAYWGGSTPRFKYHGQLYAAGSASIMDSAGKKRDGVGIYRFDNYAPKMLPIFYYVDAKSQTLRVIHDENNDGAITAADGDGTPVLDTAGKPVPVSPYGIWPRFTAFERNGDIRAARLWVFKGVDLKGIPVYEFSADSDYPIDTAKLASPYTFKTTFKRPDRAQPVAAVGRYSESVVASDGDLISGMMTNDSPHGMGLANSGCIDLARIRKDGSLRWYLAMNDYGPIQGVKQVTPGFILTSWGHQAEWIGLDDDGLSLGHLGFPQAEHWSGFWVDQPGSYTLFKGNDGRLHVMASDYSVSGWHWLSLQNYDNYRKAAFPFKVSDDRAAALAAQEPRTAFMMTRAEKPRVVIKKLVAPLTIDGDLEKWRALGLTPQVVVTPATGGSNIKSAKDCSGVIRLAYEGDNLYVQLLRFDDVVVFDPALATHLQDSLEMMINGFLPGFQFVVGKFGPDGTPVIRRKRFFMKENLDLPADVAPRVIKVLDNAAAVSERKMIEAATGEDLSQAKVIVMEFKLPIDKRVYVGAEKDVFSLESGKGFWLGLCLDDNDTPGLGGAQKSEVWPASFGTFMPKEDGVWAVFE